MPVTLPNHRWHGALCRAAARVHYRGIEVVDLAGDALRRHDSGPVLYVALHRNGAVDGFMYRAVLPDLTFLVSTQLVRSRVARVFFDGIPVARAADVDRLGLNRREAAAMNAAALHQCVDLLAAGGALCVFPEGTSDLGPRHLPFHRGAARILDAALRRGVPLRVVPLGLFYEAPERFRSRATVVLGPEVDVRVDDVAEGDRERVLMERLTHALERLGVNVDHATQLEAVERLAALAAGDSAGGAWYAAQKTLERRVAGGLPRNTARDWQLVAGAIADGRLSLDGALVARSRRAPAWSVGWLALQLALLLPGILLNLPVLLAAGLAGRKLADGRNTVALWRLLAGLPALAAWAALLGAAALLSGATWLPLAWAACTALALATWHEPASRIARLRNAGASSALHASLDRVLAWLRRESIARPEPVRATRVPGVVAPAGDLLAHERAWALLVAFTWAWLALVRGIASPEAMAWLALAAATAGAVAVAMRRPSATTWRLRLGVFLLTMNAAYFLLGPTAAALGLALRDDGLRAVDAMLFGGALPVAIDAWKHPAATELLSASYLVLYPYILLSCARRLLAVPHDLAAAQRFHAGFFTLYALGFLGYLLVPAQGAWLAAPHDFTTALNGGPLTRLNDAIVRAGTNRVDVFPSLHVAASAFMLGFDWMHERSRFRRWLIPVLLLWVSTIYLRYHYGIDVLAGFALAAAALLVARPASVSGASSVAHAHDAIARRAA